MGELITNTTLNLLETCLPTCNYAIPSDRSEWAGFKSSTT